MAAKKSSSGKKPSAPKSAQSQAAKPLSTTADTATLGRADIGLGYMLGAPALLESLRLLGFETVEQVLGAARVAGPELSAALGGISPDALVAGLPTAGVQAVSAAELEVIENATYSLGVALDRIPRPATAPDLPPPPLPSAAAGPPAAAPPAAPQGTLLGPQPSPGAVVVNLILDLPPVLNQERRGACVAFSSLAAYEHYLTTQGAWQDLSEQFLYWNCKANNGDPNTGGTWLREAFRMLKRDGCCLEEKWPYVPKPVPGNEGQGPPPGGAQLQALSYRLHAFRSLSPTSVTDIKATLKGGRCVAVSVPVYNSWWQSTWVAKTGDITNPVPGEFRNDFGHAVCLCGYAETNAPGLGGGRFILRNSWGATWGLTSPYKAGYGTIPFSYITREGLEAYAVG